MQLDDGIAATSVFIGNVKGRTSYLEPRLLYRATPHATGVFERALPRTIRVCD